MAPKRAIRPSPMNFFGWLKLLNTGSIICSEESLPSPQFPQDSTVLKSFKSTDIGKESADLLSMIPHLRFGNAVILRIRNKLSGSGIWG